MSEQAAGKVGPAPCPKCGAAVDAVKRGSYWLVRCDKHLLDRKSGHPMKTRREAVAVWNDAFSRDNTGEKQ